jgi:hypothetical protein
MERKQPIVLGINEKGELIWTNVEMPFWQRKMFPIRYSGDFGAFWQKLCLVQGQSLLMEGDNFAGFKAFVPGETMKRKRKYHKGD